MRQALKDSGADSQQRREHAQQPAQEERGWVGREEGGLKAWDGRK